VELTALRRAARSPHQISGAALLHARWFEMLDRPQWSQTHLWDAIEELEHARLDNSDPAYRDVVLAHFKVAVRAERWVAAEWSLEWLSRWMGRPGSKGERTLFLATAVSLHQARGRHAQRDQALEELKRLDQS
jgi:hypothetical protein